VKDLNASQLKVAIWSGEVKLENLTLKENALTQFDVPIRIFNGRIDKLHLKIPWKSLYTDPVVIEVDGVYVICGSEAATKYDPKKEAKENREVKMRKVKEIEEALTSQTDTAATDPGFVEKLVTQIIRNVQLTVRNIHIRYEDNIMSPDKPFSFGVTLDSLILLSTDENFRIVNSSTTTLIYKLVRMDCLAVYWNPVDKMIDGTASVNWKENLKDSIERRDHPNSQLKYILKPVSAEAKLKGTKLFDGKTPQLSIEFKLRCLSVKLSRDQYCQIVCLVDNLDRASVAHQYRKYRPSSSVLSSNQRWKFAISSIIGEVVRRKLNMWSWKYIKRHRDLCKKYVGLYTTKLSNPSPPSYIEAQIMDIEDVLDLFNIVVCRQQAMNKVMREKSQSSSSSSSSSWYSYLFGGDETAEHDKPTEQDLQQERNKLYKAIGYSKEGKAADYPKEYIAHSLKCTLSDISLELVDNEKNVSNLRVLNLTAEIDHRPASKNIDITTNLQQVVMMGASTTNQTQPKIISSVSYEKPLLWLKYQMNPLDNKMDHSIKMLVQPLEVTYNSYTVQKLIDMFELPAEASGGFQATAQVAAATLNELKEQSKAGLQHAISERKLIDVDVMLHSPLIRLPAGGCLDDSTDKVLMVDLGSIHINSDMKHHVPDVVKATREELEKDFYDYFNVTLTDIRIDLNIHDKSHQILQPLQMEVQLQKSLIPNDTRLPGFKVLSSLNSGITLTMSEMMLTNLLVLIQSIPMPVFSTRPPAPEYFEMPPKPFTAAAISEYVIADEANLQQKEKDSDEDEFITASEGEECDEDVPKSTQSEPHSPLSSTSAVISFKLPDITIQFTNELNNLALKFSSMDLSCHVNTWDTHLMASLNSIKITHSFSETTIVMLASHPQKSFLQFDMLQANELAPHYKTRYKSTWLNIEANMSSISLQVHQESVVSVLSIIENVSSVIKQPETKSSEITSIPIEKAAPPPSNKSMAISAILDGIDLSLHGNKGPLASGSLELISATINSTKLNTSISGSVQTLVVIDQRLRKQHSQVLYSEGTPLLTFCVSINNDANKMYHDLTTADITISSEIKKLRVTVDPPFIFCLLDFVKDININRKMLKAAKDIAAEKAIQTAKSIQANSSKRIKLDIEIGAPLVILPAGNGEAFKIDLGILKLTNQFQWEVPDTSVTDVLSLSISHVKLSRVVKDKSHDDHVIISPMMLAGIITRSLNSTNPPNIKVNLGDIEVSIDPNDYKTLTNLVDSIKDNIKPSVDQTSTSEVSTISNLGKVEIPLSTLVHVQISIGMLSLSVISALTKSPVTSMTIKALKCDVSVFTKQIDILVQMDKLQVINPQSELYNMVIDNLEDSRALDCLINVYTFVGDEISPNMSVELSMGRLRIIALMSYVRSLINFIQELHIKQDVIDQAKQTAQQGATLAVEKLKNVHETGQRILMKISIDPPEIVIPSSSLSKDVLIIYLGKFSLSNSFHQTSQTSPVIEQSQVTLSCIEVYKCLWSNEEEFALKESIIEPCTINAVMRRNLSASWCRDIPAISIEVTVPLIEILINSIITKVVSDVLFKNLMEKTIENTKTTELLPVASVDPPPSQSSTTKTIESSKSSQADSHDDTHDSEIIQFELKLLLKKTSINLNNTTTFQDGVTSTTTSRIADIEIINVTSYLSVSSNQKLDISLSVNEVTLDDAMPDGNHERVLGKLHNSIDDLMKVTLQKELQKLTGSVTVSSPSITVDIQYIFHLVDYLRHLAEPFTNLKPEIETEESDRVNKELSSGNEFAFTVNVLNFNIALLISTNSNTLTDSFNLKSDLSAQISKENETTFITSNLSKLNIYSKSLTQEKQMDEILSPCDVLCEMSIDEIKKISLKIDKIELLVVPRSVRTVLAFIKSLQTPENEEAVFVLPIDFWDEKAVDKTCWYFNTNIHPSKSSSVSDTNNEFLTLDIGQIVILVMQEHPITREPSKAFNVLLGSYGANALEIQARNWTGKMWAQAQLNMIMSSFNPLTDVWEPLIEPIVDKDNDLNYSSWALKATMNKLLNDNNEDMLSVLVESSIALQLTFTSSSINLLLKIIKDYTDIPGTLDIDVVDGNEYNVFVTNKIGAKYPIKLTPKQNLKLSSNESLTNLKYMEKAMLMKENIDHSQFPGKILPADYSRKNQAIFLIEVAGYKPHEISINTSGKYYYILKPINNDGKNSGLPLAVDVDRLDTNDPTMVVLRSPLQFDNHLSIPVHVFWSQSDYELTSSNPIMKIPKESSSSVPLSALLSKGYFFIKPDGASVSDGGLTWDMSDEGIVLNCKSKFINVVFETEEYINHFIKSSDRAHHVIHLHYPVILHNLLPCDVTVDGNKHTIASGAEVKLTDYNPLDYVKLIMKMKHEGSIMTGKLKLTNSKEEETIHMKSSDESINNIELKLKLNNYQWASHYTVYSPYWLINKTKYPLQYSYQDYISSKEYKVHNLDMPLMLYSDNKVSVRVETQEGSWSEWSKGFSLDTVGSEGFVTCRSTKDKDYLLGISCRLADFSLTKIITITPFYMLENKTNYQLNVLEYGLSFEAKLPIMKDELIGFWPILSKNNKLIVDIMEEEPVVQSYSLPFDYTSNGAHFIKLNSSKLSAISVHILVTGSATIITFNPYYQGAVPIQLINTLPWNIVYGQSYSQDQLQPLVPLLLHAEHSIMYTWDDPVGSKLLLWSLLADDKIIIDDKLTYNHFVIRDGQGSFKLPVGPVQSGSPEKDNKGFKKIKSKLEMVFTDKSLSTADEAVGYWVSFTYKLQRILLFTTDLSVVKSVSSVSLHNPTLRASLSLLAIGVSLVNSMKGQEIAYVGLPQSDLIWEIEKAKNLWKPVEQGIAVKVEEIFQEKKKKTEEISDELSVVYDNDNEIFIWSKTDDERNKLRRSYFNGFMINLAKSERLTSLELKVNKVQIDNQIPGAVNPTIFYCYPPPPSIASTLAPKPFIDATLILKDNREIQFLQVLIQEIGLILDLDFVVELVKLLQSFGTKISNEELMQRELDHISLSIKELKADPVSAKSAKLFLKFIHLSPIDIHLNLSLNISEDKKNELHFFANKNFVLKFILDMIYVIVSFVGKAKDAEIKLGYFEIEERALTVHVLKNTALEYYQQQVDDDLLFAISLKLLCTVSLSDV
jgi:hypothetical protein